MKSHSLKLLLAAVACGILSLIAPAAMASKSCHCVASTIGWKYPNVHDYGVIATYANLDVAAPGKCSKACSDKVSGKVDIADATAACAANNWLGGCVRGYGYIGAIGTNNADGTAGFLSCTAPKPAVVKLKCPPGWLSNTSNVAGGDTTDGKCKRLACSPLPGPLPPNGTPLGSWGFSWGNGIWQWGNAPNGGAATAVIVSPAKPGSGSWGTCP